MSVPDKAESAYIPVLVLLPLIRRGPFGVCCAERAAPSAALAGSRPELSESGLRPILGVPRGIQSDANIAAFKTHSCQPRPG